MYFNLKEEFTVHDIQAYVIDFSMQVGFFNSNIFGMYWIGIFWKEKHVKMISCMKLDSVYWVLTAETSHNTGAPV